MGNNYSAEVLSPYEVNTPLIALSFLSLCFNSVENGVFRPSNFYNNIILMTNTAVSTGCASHLQQPELGAKLGMLSAALFTFGPHFKVIYFNRFFPTWVRYGIGSFYMTYHAGQLYKAKYGFEDANEDAEDEKF